MKFVMTFCNSDTVKQMSQTVQFAIFMSRSERKRKNVLILYCVKIMVKIFPDD